MGILKKIKGASQAEDDFVRIIREGGSLHFNSADWNIAVARLGLPQGAPTPEGTYVHQGVPLVSDDNIPQGNLVIFTKDDSALQVGHLLALNDGWPNASDLEDAV